MTHPFDYITTDELVDRWNKLIAAVRDVHSQHADDLCWLDIDKIFQAAGLPVPDRSVGDKEAMLKNCKRFLDVLCVSGGCWKSYAELEEENKRLREALLLVGRTTVDVGRVELFGGTTRGGEELRKIKNIAEESLGVEFEEHT